MEDVKQELILLKQEVTELKILVHSTCNRMNDHINFVNNIYSTARNPLNYMLGKVSQVMGTSPQKELPKITES